MKKDTTLQGTGTADEWIRLYRSGLTGAAVALACDVDDILDVLNALAAAKRGDPSLEAEHEANRMTAAPQAREAAASLHGLSQVWRQRITELHDYFAEHGRMPRQGGGDEHETSLGRWLHAQRLKGTKGTLLSEQRAALDGAGPWDSEARQRRDDAKFPAQLSAVADFRALHRRLPSYKSRNDEVECALAGWLNKQRQAVGDGRLSGKFRKALDETLPGWNN